MRIATNGPARRSSMSQARANSRATGRSRNTRRRSGRQSPARWGKRLAAHSDCTPPPCGSQGWRERIEFDALNPFSTGHALNGDAMALSPLAGKPAPKEMLVDPARLERDYLERQPDPDDPAQQVSFGTSGHRGSSLCGAFNATHILAITQAICEFRHTQGVTGPLYM